MESICSDLANEHAALDEIVEAIDDEAWQTPTLSPGWAVRDQISHLWFFDGSAALAATDPDAFATHKATLLSSSGEPDTVFGRKASPPELLEAWRTGREQLVGVLRGLDPKSRVVWYGPTMGAVSFATARLMETWAHGQDIVDALGAYRRPTRRLRHVAHIGVTARPFSYLINARALPDQQPYVELEAPDGDTWTWGDPSSSDQIRGEALDFCLLVTQRRHIDDVTLDIRGAGAAEWMSIAQAFAGPPGGGRPSSTGRRSV